MCDKGTVTVLRILWTASVVLLLTRCGSDPAACPAGQELIDGACRTPGGSAEAKQFCAGYEDTCGFGGGARYSSAGVCQASFDSYNAERQDCVVNHLGLAVALDPNEHCPHAAGQSPCD